MFRNRIRHRDFMLEIELEKVQNHSYKNFKSWRETKAKRYIIEHF